MVQRFTQKASTRSFVSPCIFVEAPFLYYMYHNKFCAMYQKLSGKC